MTPRTKLLKRPVQRRDAFIVVIATEGTETEPRYFHALQDRAVIDRSRVRIEVLPTVAGESAPQHLIARLNEFAERYRLDSEIDELWAVFDTDRTKPQVLSAVSTLARAKGYRLAVSNPCFELWLLLHFMDANANHATCDACEVGLRTALSAYNKTSIQPERYTLEAVREAVRRASGLHGASTDAWPLQPPGTHVHLLLEHLLPQTN